MLPKISHLQYAVLTILSKGECSGEHVRVRLANIGWNCTKPAFYQLIERMERDNLIYCYKLSSMKKGVVVTDGVYQTTTYGRDERLAAKSFYAQFK